MLRKPTVNINRDPMIKERELIEAAKKDPARFKALYLLYHEAIFRYVYQRVGDIDTANDVVSQVFLKAMMNIKSYQYRGFPFSSWLYRIAMSETGEIFRKKKADRVVYVDSASIINLVSEVEEIKDDSTEKRLTEVLGELPEDDLQIVEMRFFEQRRFAEIGEILNITENNAKVRLYRILERMKKKINELKK